MHALPAYYLGYTNIILVPLWSEDVEASVGGSFDVTVGSDVE